MNSSRGAADEVIASGVTIDSAALFSFVDNGTAVLAGGTTFTVISNTAAAAISSAFGNLADGATITVGNNTFQGGDGNDLTLTVAP